MSKKTTSPFSKEQLMPQEEMLEIEKRQEILMGILKDVAAEHPEIRDKIMRRLSEASNKLNETVTIVHDV